MYSILDKDMNRIENEIIPYLTLARCGFPQRASLVGDPQRDTFIS